VLVLIAAGKSNRRIAQELFVGIGTVKTHISTTSTASSTPIAARRLWREPENCRELKLL
jgi:FixJ family two-component response regulator